MLISINKKSDETAIFRVFPKAVTRQPNVLGVTIDKVNNSFHLQFMETHNISYMWMDIFHPSVSVG